jgi:hypothetical protein
MNRKRKPLWIFEYTGRWRNDWGKLFDYVYQKYVQKDRWSLELWFPLIHIYYENYYPYE